MMSNSEQTRVSLIIYDVELVRVDGPQSTLSLFVTMAVRCPSVCITAPLGRLVQLVV